MKDSKRFPLKTKENEKEAIKTAIIKSEKECTRFLFSYLILFISSLMNVKGGFSFRIFFINDSQIESFSKSIDV